MDCPEFGKAIKDEDIVGNTTIEDLLQSGFEKHVGTFEIPQTILSIMNGDEFNASVNWYLQWKLRVPINKQNTCTILTTFGYKEAQRVIIAINFYKYLINNLDDPNIVEIFLNKQ